MEKVTKLVQLSQVSFLVLIGVCVAIMPHFLFERNEGGMSNYGVYVSTVVFYTLAFLLSAGLLLRAAKLLPKERNYRRLKVVFEVTAYTLLLVLITTYPYQRSNTYANIHTATNIWTTIFEMSAGLWIALIWQRSVVTRFGLRLN